MGRVWINPIFWLEEENWKCFTNSKVNPASGEWELIKKPHIDLIEKVYI